MTDIGEGAFSASEESAPQEEKPKKDKRRRVKIRFCVFFDGTLNNRTNVEARERNTDKYQEHKPKPGKAGNSYEGDKTNVAKMESYIDKTSLGKDQYLLTTYIEGPGTEDLEGDSFRGSAFGTGDTGVKEKVEKGVDRVVHLLKSTLKKNPIIEELVLDIFGFSRGAAGARYFIHKTLSDKSGLFSSPVPLADKIRAKGFEIDKKNVRVEFVGLYDTVSSEGLSHNDVNSLKLKAVSRPEVKTVVHLAAADEHRSNFALTTIKSAIGKGGREIFLPGVHSDIGGGYRNNIEENLVLNESQNLSSLEKDRKHLLSQGWFTEEQIYIESPPALEVMISLHGEMPQREPHRLKSRRTGLDNGYAKIPLNIMADFFCETGMILEDKFQMKEAPPTQLSGVYENLSAYAQKDKSAAGDWHGSKCYDRYSWLKDLRNQQLHFSAHYQRSYMVLAAHKPRIRKGQRERITIRG